MLRAVQVKIRTSQVKVGEIRESPLQVLLVLTQDR